MSLIKTDPALRGIDAPFAFSPRSAVALSGLAQAILLDPEGLTRAERELIASYVSKANDCPYCTLSHGAVAQCALASDESFIEHTWNSPETAPLPAKLKPLLRLADQVRRDAKGIDPSLADAARACGATDKDIHDTILIAAAFCLFNRYVDALGGPCPSTLAAYLPEAQSLLARGYLPPSP